MESLTPLILRDLAGSNVPFPSTLGALEHLAQSTTKVSSLRTRCRLHPIFGEYFGGYISQLSSRKIPSCFVFIDDGNTEPIVVG